MLSARWAVVQTAVAVSASWFLTHDLLGHPQPFFAPIAAAVSLSASDVLRGQRAVQLMTGVALGIAIGTVVQAVAGTGALAFALAALVAMYAALAVGGGMFGQGLMFVNQTTASAVLILALHKPGSGTERLVDALIGGGVVVVIGVLLLPADPDRLLREATQRLFTGLRDALTDLAGQLAENRPRRTGDEPAAWELEVGQRIHGDLAALAQARKTARHVVFIAPRRRPRRDRVRRAAAQSERLTLQANAVLSLVRITGAALAAGEHLPPPFHDAVTALAEACGALAGVGGADSARAAADRALCLLEPLGDTAAGFGGAAIHAARAGARDLLAAVRPVEAGIRGR
ncbi:FUSC family protein [Amycolatopsis sp. FDAARGOS 1241]|nr:FUSC family protein [Amycolatopsis sp. FDAARGOS 1241]